MRAGKLRNRVAIQEDRGTQNTTGEVESFWKTVASRWAEITAVSGDERLAGDQFKSQTTHQVKLRYTDILTVRHRILFGTRALHILSARDPDGRQREMVLDCEERV